MVVWGRYGDVGGVVLFLVTLLVDNRVVTRRAVIANMVASTGSKSPLVKTGILIGNTKANSVTGISNGCDIGIPGNGGMLMFSYMNCGRRRVALGPKRGILGIAVGRSARLLSRMMIVNCNSVGGDSLANSIADVGDRSLVGAGPVDVGRKLRKHVTNIRIGRGSNTPKTKMDVRVHNTGSFSASARPLCVISNVPFADDKVPKANGSNVVRATGPLSAVGPSSVRSVRVLGSTSTATVCKSHNTGNIMLVAAGHNTGKGSGVDFDTGFKVSGMIGGLSVLSKCTCTVCEGRTAGVFGRCRGTGRLVPCPNASVISPGANRSICSPKPRSCQGNACPDMG